MTGALLPPNRLRFTCDLNGPRRCEYEDSRRRIGYGERVFLQRSEAADMVIPCIRGKDPERDTEQLAASEHPFERWFTAELLKYHGVDFSQPVPSESERVRAFGVIAPVIS